MVSSRALEHRLEQWRQELAAWAVPEGITLRGQGGPGVRRRVPPPSEVQAPPPGSGSFEREMEALPSGGTVLDVGAGAGGASLPLSGRAGLIVALDERAEQLSALRQAADVRGISVRTVLGRWPEAAGDVEPADLVTCHHVLFGVGDLEPFLVALTTRARRRVVVELSVRHPQWPLNPLWARFYGLRRPQTPTALDVAAIAELLGLRPHVQTWVDAEGWGAHSSFEELVERTRRKLYLPADRQREVADALRGIGVDPANPKSVGTVGRRLITIWWEGSPG